MDKNIMPEIKILKCPPPMEGIARAIAKALRVGRETELCLTEHNTGAAVMLDAAIETQGVLFDE